MRECQCEECQCEGVPLHACDMQRMNTCMEESKTRALELTRHGNTSNGLSLRF